MTSTDTEASDEADDWKREIDRTVAGGGTLTASVSHRDADRGRSLAAKLETAVEAVNARYFNEAPRQTLGRREPVRHGRELRPIREAIDAANDRPSVRENIDGEMQYVVEEPYYPDEYSHFVDVTGIAVDDRASAFLHAQSELCRRGYALNSVRTNDENTLTRFHVVALSWVYSARGYGHRDGV